MLHLIHGSKMYRFHKAGDVLGVQGVPLCPMWSIILMVLSSLDCSFSFFDNENDNEKEIKGVGSSHDTKRNRNSIK